jgi:hypothetical protein
MKLDSFVGNGARLFINEYEVVLNKKSRMIDIHNKKTHEYLESWPIGKVRNMKDFQVEIAYWERSKI